MENHRGKIIFIFAGYNKQMETFFEHNPGLPSRVPNSLQFEDYTDVELLKILESRIHRRYDGKMKVEDGIKGLYGRIAVRRLGRGRGKEGFGNARALENLFSVITARHAARVTAERRAGRAADDFLFIREDIIGLEPSASLLDQCDAWKELHALIGLAAVKESVEMLVDRIQINYQRDLREQEPLEMSLNRVFLGSPGTGKTSVAKLYGQILARLGLLSNGEVVVKNPSDFIGQYIGQSEAKTKAILETTKGKVLVIDEAYGLYGGGNSGSNTGAFKTSVIDTIVAEVQGDPRDDRCVLLLGYKDQMIEMFQNVNPGLSRRFAIEQAFNFDDFASAELLQILELKLKKQNLLASPDGKKVGIERLEREKRRANFGNGGAVDNLLSVAKANAVRRLKGQKIPAMMTLEPQDFDPDYDRASNASDNLDEMFKDVVGCENVVAKLRMYQKVALTKRNRGEDSNDLIPTNFVFKGPPGTGKTTTARKMGQVYYDMGFLAKPDVIECSASDLVGQYVGQTGPKTRKVFEKALGQVLFIDEAYRLKNGHFAQEAVDEMVDLLTQDKYKGKMVVILAGYDQDINDLLSVNRGLSSRFPEEIIFTNLSMPQCMQILQKELQKSGISLRGIESSSSPFYIDLADLMMDLSQLPSWGNARDVITLSKKMVSLAYQQNLPDLALSPEDAMKCAVEMYTEPNILAPPMATDNSSASAPSANSSSAGNSAPPPPPPPRKDTPPPPSDEKKDEPGNDTSSGDGRDPGVTDDIWNQLQADKKKAAEAVKAMEAAVQAAERAKVDAAKKEEKERKAANKLASDIAKAQDVLKKDRLRQKREACQRREAKAKREREKQEAELKRRQERLEKQRKEEIRVQTRLRQMGVCVAGFVWIKQAGGYRCAGGTHFASNAQLGI
ncbi:P-loop containing nucleoside triphosphate hydrolase protein [Hymenopellis radicata]|nr:P-loop containing nucleoside triphosphate hydrolase protein [Hymenopellis radicata]